MSEENLKLPAEKTPLELSKETIKETDEKLLNEIVASESSDELTAIVKKFQLNQAKKNALRAVKLNDLIDKVQEQATERIDKCPDEFTNKELIDYLKTTNDLLNTTSKNLTPTEDVPSIQINQQHNEIKIEDKSLNQESREKIIDFVNMALSAAKQVPVEKTEEDVVVEGIVEQKPE